MPEATIATGKQARKTFILMYIADESEYEVIGKGIEELSIEQGANVETTNDVLGNTETILDKYEKSTALDPIYVEGGVKFSELLDEIEEKNLILDDVVKEFLWVKTYKTSTGSKYAAWKQKAVVELTSFGGGTKGVNAHCTLHWIGERTYGTFDLSSETFTEDGAGS